MVKSITWPEFNWTQISLAEDKAVGKTAQELKQEVKTAAGNASQRHQGGNPFLV